MYLRSSSLSSFCWRARPTGWTLVLAVLLAGLLRSPAQAQPHAVAAESLFGLGRIAAEGGPIALHWDVTNTGTEPLLLGAGESTHPSLVGRWPRTPIQPGQRVRIEATFDPTGYNARNAVEELQILHNGRGGVLLLSFFGRWARRGEEPNVPEMPPRSDTGSRWGYIDRNGREVIPPTFQWASPFSEGLAVVKMDGLYGYADERGRVAIPCTYAVNRDFQQGQAWVLSSDKKWGSIDREGKFVIPPQFDDLHGDGRFRDGMTAVRKGSRWYFIDQRGRDLGLVNDPQITDLYVPSEGYAWFSYGSYGKGGKWGFMDLRGRVVAPPTYDYSNGSFYGGLTRVTVGELNGYVNDRNELVLPARYSDGSEGSEGRVVAREGDTYRAFDSKGRPLFDFPAGTVGASSSVEGRYCYLTGRPGYFSEQRRGYLDEQGRVVVPPQYKYYNNYHYGRALGSSPDGRAGFIDRAGQIVIGFEYDDVGHYGANGLAPVKGERTLTARQTRPDTPDDGLTLPTATNAATSTYRPGLLPAGPLPLAYLPPQYEGLGEPLKLTAPGTVRPPANAAPVVLRPLPTPAPVVLRPLPTAAAPADTSILHSLRLGPTVAARPARSAPTAADTSIYHSLLSAFAAPVSPAVTTPPVAAPAPTPVMAPPAPAVSPATWQGRVLDARTKLPLPAAVLTIAQPAATLPLRPTGQFAYATAADTEFAYEARLPGYVPANATLRLPAGGLRQDILLEPLAVGATVQLDNIGFLQSRYQLLPASFAALNKLVALMQQYPLMTIELRGHTDNQGSAEKNVVLSEQRVAEVKKYLQSKGVAEARITGRGFGGSQPIADNRQEYTRKLNRRVEFRITKLE